MNNIEVLMNDNNDDATTLDDHMVEMVNVVYLCFNENPNVNFENDQPSLMEEMDYI